jgi:hypothetical protein
MSTELFLPAHLIALCKENADVERLNGAIINQISGPAFTLVEDGKILGCGGIRTAGIGQAWAYFSRDALKDKPRTILQESRAAMNEMIAENRIYRVYADPEAGDDWFKHLGFVKQEKVFVR